MDKVKTVYNFAVAWVGAHPAASVNAILVAVAAKLVLSVVL
jgi:hypothetical protein